MTSRHPSHNWLDVLYNDVRSTPGGVKEAASFLTERRGKRIHYESLRAKLNGQEGESMTFEMADLLTEWMLQYSASTAFAHRWAQTYATVEHGLTCLDVPLPPEGGWPDELKAIHQKVLQVGAKVGGLNSSTLEAMADGRIDPGERSELYTLFMELAVLAFRGARNVSRVQC